MNMQRNLSIILKISFKIIVQASGRMWFRMRVIMRFWFIRPLLWIQFIPPRRNGWCRYRLRKAGSAGKLGSDHCHQFSGGIPLGGTLK